MYIFFFLVKSTFAFVKNPYLSLNYALFRYWVYQQSMKKDLRLSFSWLDFNSFHSFSQPKRFLYFFYCYSFTSFWRLLFCCCCCCIILRANLEFILWSLSKSYFAWYFSSCIEIVLNFFFYCYFECWIFRGKKFKN